MKQRMPWLDKYMAVHGIMLITNYGMCNRNNFSSFFSTFIIFCCHKRFRHMETFINSISYLSAYYIQHMVYIDHINRNVYIHANIQTYRYIHTCKHRNLIVNSMYYLVFADNYYMKS